MGIPAGAVAGDDCRGAGDDPGGRCEAPPDLYAGEVAAAGRLLVRVSADLARHALRAADLYLGCRQAAEALEEMAALPPFADTPNGRALAGVAAGLREALRRCRGA